MMPLTERARRVLARSEAVAREAGAPEVQPHHLLASLLAEEGSMATRLLVSLGANVKGLSSMALPEAATGRPGPTSARSSLRVGQVPFAPETKGIIDQAADEARSIGHAYVGTEHLLLALAAWDGPVGRLLRQQGASPDALRSALRQVLG